MLSLSPQNANLRHESTAARWRVKKLTTRQLGRLHFLVAGRRFIGV